MPAAAAVKAVSRHARNRDVREKMADNRRRPAPCRPFRSTAAFPTLARSPCRRHPRGSC
ncbi:hypothetical protein BURMUCF2_A1915 [Burkholderia multivorans CF2]|nr:hypothetical protein BURMUCF2_A1915 [Burkholderia multivorans CF2]